MVMDEQPLSPTVLQRFGLLPHADLGEQLCRTCERRKLVRLVYVDWVSTRRHLCYVCEHCDQAQE